MKNHIIKYDHRDGVKLSKHEIETWCGHKPKVADWLFQDAQHAILSIEQHSDVAPCSECLKAIIKMARQSVPAPKEITREEARSALAGYDAYQWDSIDGYQHGWNECCKEQNPECEHQYVYGWHSNGKASGYYCRFCGKLQEV
ncbi:hypothetical protein [Kosakonia radicincitans]|uniref:hypothetical protein n=1 Tax=Kosakonia radicincitans TaxID=283686 RepID=UPI001D078414|nr:hypothetical protein [Kosakonia radicincitans]